MDNDIARFFRKMPQAVPLYAAFEKMLHSRYTDLAIRVERSRISIANRHVFAYVRLPIGKVKKRPEGCMILSFWLPYRIESPRIMEEAEGRRNSWTHHVIIEKPADIDEQLIEWIDLSYHFSMTN